MSDTTTHAPTLDELGASDPAGVFDSLPIWSDGSTDCGVCLGTTSRHNQLRAGDELIPCPIDVEAWA